MAERATSSVSVASDTLTVTEEVDGKTEEHLSSTHIRVAPSDMNRRFIRVLKPPKCGGYHGIHRAKTSGTSALDHITVLDLSRIAAGPFCSMILGDLGATIYKVESVGNGDETRRWPPNLKQSPDEMSCYFASLNRNKKSLCVDFKSKDGLNIIYELAKKSDVLLENFVPGKLTELGLGYEKMGNLVPGLVYCSISGYGSRGPYMMKPGYDNIAASVGGLFHITGPAGGDPCKVGVALTDLATGLYAHGAILAALIHRQKTGLGQKVDVNLLSTQVATLINIGSNYLNVGKEAVRWGTQHESIVPYQAFRTSDGYITVGTGSDEQFRVFCKMLGLTNVLEDSRYKTNSLRVKNRESLLSIIEPIFLGKTSQEMLRILDGAPFPFGPVNNMEQVFNDPHIKEIGLVREMTTNVGTLVKVVGPPVDFSGMENAARSPPPGKGQHTREILSSVLNYPERKIQKLFDERVVE